MLLTQKVHTHYLKTKYLALWLIENLAAGVPMHSITAGAINDTS